MCVISVRGLSSLDAWLRGFVSIFTISLGFTKCFCKSFRSLEVISQPFGSQKEKRKTFLQPISKFGNHFTTILKFGKSFRNQKAIFTANGGFHTGLLWGCEIISQPKGSFVAHGENRNIFAAILKLRNRFVAKMVISQPIGDFTGGTLWLRNHFITKRHFCSGGWISLRRAIFAAHFAAAKWAYGCCEMALVCQRVVSQLQNTL